MAEPGCLTGRGRSARSPSLRAAGQRGQPKLDGMTLLRPAWPSRPPPCCSSRWDAPRRVRTRGRRILRLASTATRTLPPTTGSFDYQLGGVVHARRRRHRRHPRQHRRRPRRASTRSATSTGSRRSRASSWPSNLILQNKAGKPIVDPGWPDERIIDISTAAKRTRGEPAHRHDDRRRARRRASGAVEFDNLDSYSRSKGRLDPVEDDRVREAPRASTPTRRARGRARRTPASSARAARRRSASTSSPPRSATSTASAASFTKVYGTHVLDIEYTDDLRGTFDAGLRSHGDDPPQTILRDRDLTTPNEPDGVTCRTHRPAGAAHAAAPRYASRVISTVTNSFDAPRAAVDTAQRRHVVVVAPVPDDDVALADVDEVRRVVAATTSRRSTPPTRATRPTTVSRSSAAGLGCR